ncbi:MAG: serine/threonine protein kinase [Planctomycetota bacterium]|nr:MAG: serine/threonine protein kinase [Planctomycetota bacterium]
MEIEIIEEPYRYKLTREIARGGMGAVYEAQLSGAEGFQKRVALKVILEQMMNDEQFVEMFIAEAKLVANLIHQNIAQVYQLGRYKDSFYIAMEYIDGVNLEEFFIQHEEKKIKIAVEIVTFIVSRVCRGLSYAHNKKDDQGVGLNLVHRDVSLKNIMIAIEGEVKVTDFGIAKANNYFKDMEGEVIMGKAEYMSPEQAQYKKTDGRSDLFSLGIVFYELLTGVNPFYDDDIQNSLKKVVSEEVKPPSSFRSEIPKEIDEIVMKALVKDQDHRYQTASEMLYALEYYMYHDRFGPTCETLADYLGRLNGKENYHENHSEPSQSSSTIRRKLLE